jgi:hypothetical protein
MDALSPVHFVWTSAARTISFPGSVSLLMEPTSSLSQRWNVLRRSKKLANSTKLGY